MSDKVDKVDSGAASRRDFLGKACLGGFLTATSACVLGLAKAVMPDAPPDPSQKFKIGLPNDYPEGTELNFEDENVIVFRDGNGFYAISTVCTHLGCIVSYDNEAGFDCPCHGSKFETDGKVRQGPAPTALPWLEVSLLPSGQLAVDKSKSVPMGTKTSA